ncbi:MAG: hypothetical protein GEU93_02450 [Propionibacteriales bacterium]|nr:hypothetical protein [Propionibacteriales bacterium]
MRGRPDRYTDGSDPLSDPKKVRRFIAMSRPGAAILAVVVIVVGLVVALSQFTGNDEASPQTVTEERTPRPRASATAQDADTPKSPATGKDATRPEEVPEDAVRAAIDFTNAWKLRDNRSQRRAALERVATPHLTEALLLVPASELSKGDIVGEPEPDAYSNVYANLHVTLSTGEVIAVSVAQQPDGSWVAVDVQQVRKPRTDDTEAEERETESNDRDESNQRNQKR